MCTVVQALRLCTGCRFRRGSRGIGKFKVYPCSGTEALYKLYGIAVFFLDHGTRRV